MKKTYILEELDCANCAAKMQEGIKKINVVNEILFQLTKSLRVTTNLLAIPPKVSPD